MQKRLVPYGDGLALVIEQALLDQLNIDADTPLEVSTDGQTLIVTPVTDEERKAAFEKALEDMDRQYGSVFKRLAE